MAENPKIGFVLLSNSQAAIPSTRIVVLNMLPYLRAAGFDPHIVFDPVIGTATPELPDMAARLKLEGFQIIFFQKVHGPSAVALAMALRAVGIKTVFGICDYVQIPMVEATDLTITVTDYLRELHPTHLQSKIFTVHDGIENIDAHKVEWGTHRGSQTKPLQAVLVTSFRLDRLPVLISPPSWLQVTIVGNYAPLAHRSQRWKEAVFLLQKQNSWRDKLKCFRFLVNPRIRRVAWDAWGVYDAMRQADIGIIPIESDVSQGALVGWQMKSENRLTLKMSMGLPVVATPIPAYLPVIVQGQNGFLARDRDEWLSCLAALRDPALRKSMGQRARITATQRFSMELQAEKLVRVLRSLTKGDNENRTDEATI